MKYICYIVEIRNKNFIELVNAKCMLSLKIKKSWFSSFEAVGKKKTNNTQ